MPGFARSSLLRSLIGLALLSSTSVAQRGQSAQLNVVSARLSSTGFLRSGPDSGKVILAVEIANLPAAIQSVQLRERVKVTDDAGRTYTPVGVGGGSVGSINSMVPEYLQASNVRRTRPQYMFFVPAGTTRFVLHVPSQSPVPFIASVTAGKFDR